MKLFRAISFQTSLVARLVGAAGCRGGRCRRRRHAQPTVEARRNADGHRAAEPVTLTPAFNTATPTQIVAGNIFDGLVYYDPALKPAAIARDGVESCGGWPHYQLQLAQGRKVA